MNHDEYEAQLQRLTDEMEAAHATIQRARRQWYQLCEERLKLSWKWRQQNGAQATEGKSTVGHSGNSRVWCLADVPPGEQCAKCGRDGDDVARAAEEPS